MRESDKEDLASHMQHNFGHAQKNLSTVFATLTILSFLVDQVQNCPLVVKVMGKFNSRRAYWHTAFDAASNHSNSSNGSD
ncbi:MAG: hypothetical protein K9M08_14320 [Pirellula sp.]|nr:hypothetical protein [Pirellula sp.]